MMKVNRSLAEINADINEHTVALKGLRDEIKLFQAECPHPVEFDRVTYSQHTDEYGSNDGGTNTHECLMCGHKEYVETSN